MKIASILSVLLLAAGDLALAAETPAPAAKPESCACCAAKPAAKTDGACCQAAPAGGAFSKESIYQLDATFTDDTGRTVPLGSLRGRPVVLDMFFTSCGYACPLTVADMQVIQKRLPPAGRSEALFVLVSFDVARDTPAVLAQYRMQHGLDGQWVLLHGDDEAVRELAAVLGVKFKQGVDGSFAHSNLLTILNRQGEIVHQREGLQGGLDEATAALSAAVAGK